VPAGATLRIDLDNALGDDGFPGEGDTTIDIENTFSHVAGTFVGNLVNNSITVSGAVVGNSQLSGGGGNDTLVGGAGAETCSSAGTASTR
jgi:hypothetical protein